VPETVLVLLEKNGAGKSTMLKKPKTLLLIPEVCAGKEVRMGFCVRISILSKEEQYLRKLTSFVDIKIVEKKIRKSIIYWLYGRK
jgi:ABC-type Na+ transport system ATPase subunit NatA